MNDILDHWQYFSTPVYSIKKQEFLEAARKVSNTNLSDARKQAKINEIYPVVHADVSSDEKLWPLFDYVLNTAWNLLDGQGYNMDGLSTYFTECWAQEHHKYSSMDYHNHNDCELIAFYFLECPKDPPKMAIHDPRSMRLSKLREKNLSEITHATATINFTPEPGQLIFANAWLPHSFTRNASTKPFKFIHMNIDTRVYQAPPVFEETAEII
jgi:hypothetical protein